MKLAEKPRYVSRQDFVDLEAACKGLENVFKNRLIVNTAKDGEHSIMFVLDNGNSVILKLNVNADFPQVLLTNCDHNGRRMNGIYSLTKQSVF